MSAQEGGAPRAERRVFLGHDDPLAVAAGHLLDAAAAVGGEVDLGATTVVVPGGRARRQLLRELVVRAQSRGLRVVPPRLVLPNEIECAVRDALPLPIADESTTLLAWAAALAAAEESERARLAPAGLPDLARRLRTARRLLDAHRELAAAGVPARTVAAAAERRGADGGRYLALERVAAAAREALAAVGLIDADDARERALERPPRGTGPVWLLGTVDLPQRARRALEGSGARLGVMCVATPDQSEAFDDLGAVVPGVWAERLPAVPLERIRLVGAPLDQAEAVAAHLAELAAGGVLDADRCAVVLADAELAAPVARELSAAGVGSHDAAGVAFAGLPPGRVLTQVALHLAEPTTRSLRALLREPAVERAIVKRLRLGGPGAALATLDRWLEAHHDRPLGERWWRGVQNGGDPPRAVREVEPVALALQDLLAPLGTARTLAALGAPVLALMRELFEAAPPSGDRGVTDGALLVLRDLLATLAVSPPGFQPTGRPAEALGALLELLRTERVREMPRPDEIDLVGWLELPFDPATELVIAGMNDGCVPAAVHDPWLPDALRGELGLADDARRAARDAWILSTALSRGSASFVLGRRNAGGEPLAPSRLLMTGRGEELARRVEALTRDVERGPIARPRAGAFAPPPPPDGPIPLPAIRVTAFARYLQSPYRCWLEQVLRLAEPRPAGDELDGARIGMVVHSVLEAFGRRPEVNASTDVATIERALQDELDAVLAEAAGEAPGAGLRIQRRVLRERLRWFAERQAKLVTEGWRIRHAEIAIEDELDVPGDDPVVLRGKVDRIDYHEREQRWRIIDYKTSDVAKKPDIAHRAQDGTWRDLQLPLYAHLLAQRLATEAPGSVEVGYFNLADRPLAVGFCAAERLIDSVGEAVDEARRIVRAIRAGELPMPDTAPAFESPGISILCRTPALAVAGDEEDA